MTIEILNEAYEDEGPSPVFGAEAGETTGNRSAFDDVDDYHAWSASPPEARNGTALANLTGWQREVTVELVDPSDPADPSAVDQGAKRVTVTVSRNGTVLSRQVSLRSDKYRLP